MKTLGDWLARLLTSHFFSRPDAPLSSGQVIIWWETRRVPFNLIVGAAGAVSGASMFATALVCERLIGEPIGLSDPAIFEVIGAIVFAIMANVCYTGGWVTELLLERVWGLRPPRFAQIAFTLGLLFSTVLALLPGVAILLFGAVSLVLHALGIYTPLPIEE